MQELSLYILDITENSVSAGADLIEILIDEDGPIMTIRIRSEACRSVLHHPDHPTGRNGCSAV